MLIKTVTFHTSTVSPNCVDHKPIPHDTTTGAIQTILANTRSRRASHVPVQLSWRHCVSSCRNRSLGTSVAEVRILEIQGVC